MAGSSKPRFQKASGSKGPIGKPVSGQSTDIEVSVATMKGAVKTIRINPNITVGTFKTKIAHAFNFSESEASDMNVLVKAFTLRDDTRRLNTIDGMVDKSKFIVLTRYIGG